MPPKKKFQYEYKKTRKKPLRRSYKKEATLVGVIVIVFLAAILIANQNVIEKTLGNKTFPVGEEERAFDILPTTPSEIKVRDINQIESSAGPEDKTILAFSGWRKLDDNENEVTVTIISKDNNQEGDGNGGLITLENAEITSVEQIDWDQNCVDNNTFRYECIKATTNEIKWFNYVFNESDTLKFTVKFTDNAFLILKETGGMECGAYYQTAQHGSYKGFPDRTGGLDCTKEKTFIGNQLVSSFGGFPLRMRLEL